MNNSRAFQIHYARICLHECRARMKRPERHQKEFALTLFQWAKNANTRRRGSRIEPKLGQMELFA